MALTELDLVDIFKYHPPDEEQILRLSAVREAAHEFAVVLLRETPTSPDQTFAIRLVRQAVMTANAAIALKGRY